MFHPLLFKQLILDFAIIHAKVNHRTIPKDEEKDL